MANQNISEERLNLFIDEQLDSEEMDAIHKAVLEDASLRERVCQLKAVRELVGYAYSEVPASRYTQQQNKPKRPVYYRAIAASVLVFIGVLLGWSTYHYTPNAVKAISAENAFQYVANHVVVDHQQRKIVLHIDSGDIKVVNAALDEADQLLATYRKANTPMKLDVVANKGGINILRDDISPYQERIQKLIEDENVAFYACARALAKAKQKEGGDIRIIKGVTTDKTVKELIPDRLKNGWIYIKA